jgi:hypothetical protein
MLYLLSKRFVVRTSKVLYPQFLYEIPFYVRGENEQIRNETMKRYPPWKWSSAVTELAVSCHSPSRNTLGCSLSSQLPLPAVAATAVPLVTSMYSEACVFLVQAAGYTGDHVLQNEEVEKRDSRAGRHAVLRV